MCDTVRKACRTKQGLPNQKRRPSATDKVPMKLGLHYDRGYEIVGNRILAYKIVRLAERVSVNPH